MRPRWLTAALAVAALQACRGGGAGVEPGGMPAPPSAAELEARYRARVDSSLARFTEADAAFMAGMIGHHAQALEMAALASARAASPDVRTLASRVTTGQEAEIALMRRWLEERGLPAPPGTGDHGGGPGGAHAADGAHAEASPGMLTPEQMGELERARGSDFDALFLRFMIQHHEGAVTMVERLFATPGAASDASTFRIASGIQVDQRSEIRRMESMLEEIDRGRAGR
jgi:uncharacterized protein (DUF305 family)